IEAELAKLRSEDPRYKKFVDDVEQLQVQSAAFSRAAASALQQATRLLASITERIGAIGAFQDELTSTTLDLDPVTHSYLIGVQNRANERLLKYHYYFAKAYEYRMLKSYPRDFRQDVSLERLIKLASASANPTSSASLSPSTHAFRLTPAEFDALKS